jgi:protein-L-isoaspartate(D-aspartate) O-methyltransferase
MQLCDNCQRVNARGMVPHVRQQQSLTQRYQSRMDFDQARSNMIESQIRTWDVLDQAVLDAIAAVKREDFVPERYRELAFADMQIPLRADMQDPGEVMLTPKLEARMLQELSLTFADRVLEIGTGSGYVTALLARLAREVVSIEIVPEFAEQAQGRLRSAGITNVLLEAGDGANGWEQAGPYDAILLTGSVPVLPPAMRAQLKTGGRLLAVIGNEPVMSATLVVRVSENDYSQRVLFETCIAPLRNVSRASRFVF